MTGEIIAILAVGVVFEEFDHRRHSRVAAGHAARSDLMSGSVGLVVALRKTP